MNHSTLAVLLDDNVQLVECIFTEKGKKYTYKTLDKTIKEGDLVVVECYAKDYDEDGQNFNAKVVKVIKVNTQVDFNSSTQYKWVIQKLDYKAFEELKFREDKLISDFHSLELKHKKKSIREALGIEGVETLKLTNQST